MDEELLRRLFELIRTEDFEVDQDILRAGFESLEQFNRLTEISNRIDNLVELFVEVDSEERRMRNRQQWIETAIRMILNQER